MRGGELSTTDGVLQHAAPSLLSVTDLARFSLVPLLPNSPLDAYASYRTSSSTHSTV